MNDPTGRVFDALADPNRRYVLEALAERETATATELAAELPVTRQAVAKHLAALSEAGLVEGRRQGRETLYELTGGWTVPQITIGDEVIGGYTELWRLDRSGHLAEKLAA